MEQRSINTHSPLPQLTKCKSCSNIISNVITRSKQRQYCESCDYKTRTLRAVKFSKEVFKRWKDTQVPIYKFDVLHQTALKFAILSMATPTMTKNQRKASVVKYHHSPKARVYFRQYDRIVRLGHFAKFWDRLEFTRKCRYCSKPSKETFCSEKCHNGRKNLDNKLYHKNYIRREEHQFMPW